MLSYSEYEKILRKGKKVDWYDTIVPEELLTPTVKYVANQIIEQINKYEGVDSSKNNTYILNLWANVKDLPYTLNGDFYLIKKKEIEDKIKKEGKKKPEIPKPSINGNQKGTKNSKLIFGK